MQLPFIPPVWRFVGAGVVIALGSVLIVSVTHSCKQEHDSTNANLVIQGKVTERAAQEGETINAVKNAQEAVQHPTSNQLDIVCSRYDRNCPTHHP